MAESMDANLNDLPGKSIEVDRVGERVEIIMSNLNNTIAGLGPLAGEGEAAEAFKGNFEPGLEGGIRLLKGVKEALSAGTDNLINNVRAMNHTENVNVEGVTNHTNNHSAKH